MSTTPKHTVLTPYDVDQCRRRMAFHQHKGEVSETPTYPVGNESRNHTRSNAASAISPIIIRHLKEELGWLQYPAEPARPHHETVSPGLTVKGIHVHLLVKPATPASPQALASSEELVAVITRVPGPRKARQLQDYGPNRAYYGDIACATAILDQWAIREIVPADIRIAIAVYQHETGTVSLHWAGRSRMNEIVREAIPAWENFAQETAQSGFNPENITPDYPPGDHRCESCPYRNDCPSYIAGSIPVDESGAELADTEAQNALDAYLKANRELSRLRNLEKERSAAGMVLKAYLRQESRQELTMTAADGSRHLVRVTTLRRREVDWPALQAALPLAEYEKAVSFPEYERLTVKSEKAL